MADIEEVKAFYANYLGLEREDLSLDWVIRFVVPGSGEHIQLVSRDATVPENPRLTVTVDDVDDAHAEALRHGYEIVHSAPVRPARRHPAHEGSRRSPRKRDRMSLGEHIGYRPAR